MKPLLVAVLTAGAWLGLVAQTSAHHSFAATYIEDKAITIEGELINVIFRDPHSFVQLTVTERDGSMARYSIEWGGAGRLGVQGVTRETLKVGDHLVVSGNPGRNPSDHRVRMLSLRRPSDGFHWDMGLGEADY
jgi:hypothetical protein